jgi:uncharacterized membrane protein YsdA (DUF1294 family)
VDLFRITLLDIWVWFISYPFLTYFVIVNVISFFQFGADKRRAEKNKYRISERSLLLFGFAGGWLGGYLGQYYFRHKTGKLSFKIRFFVAAIANMLIIAGVFSKIETNAF